METIGTTLAALLDIENENGPHACAMALRYPSKVKQPAWNEAAPSA
jgi:hypothetical protein